MPSREFAMLVEESSYGTPVTSPTKGTNLFYPRLHDGDSFTGQMNPDLLDIMYGGGRATPAVQVSDSYSCPFTFKTYIYPGAYSAMLLNWCMTPIDSGRAVPWATTDAALVMPPGDLASISIYHAITLNDGSIERKRYSGCKVHSWSLTCSRSDPRAALTITGVAQRDDLNAAGSVAYPNSTEFPAPLETDYPQAPYLFSHSAGFFVIDVGTTIRTQYNSVGMTCTNAMDAIKFESNYLIMDRFNGRTTSLNADLHMKLSPADVSLLQTKTVLNSSLKFYDGTHLFKIDFQSHNYFKSVARSLPLATHFRRAVSVQIFWDPVGTGDLILTTS